MSGEGWLALGEGALAFVLGIVLGSIYVLVRIVTGGERRRRCHDDDDEAPLLP